MRIPTIHGWIDRRILINFTVDPSAAERVVPAPFRPKIYQGKAIAGICLIRLKHIKPKGFPDFFGVNSENGAHRIAVEWDEAGQMKEGVYIPRRDTSFRLNAILGGRLFPGKHHLAKFNVDERDNHYHINYTSSDNTKMCIDAVETENYDRHSIFGTLENASEFFKTGAVGYSPNGTKFDGLKLDAFTWKMRPLQVNEVKSSYFENEALFPEGSVKFDNALLMTKIEHQWHSVINK